MELTQIVAEYANKYRICKAKEEKVEALIEKIEKQLKLAKKQRSTIHYPLWVNEVLTPIAEEMLKQMPDRYFRTSGTLSSTGLCRMDEKTSIHFYRKGIFGKEKIAGDNCLSIIFTPRDLGFDNENYPTPEYRTTIDEMMQWIKEQNAKKGDN